MINSDQYYTITHGGVNGMINNKMSIGTNPPITETTFHINAIAPSLPSTETGIPLRLTTSCSSAHYP